MGASDNAIEYMRRRRAAMTALANQVAKRAEGDMRIAAPWKDRTAHARQALHTGVERSGDDKLVLYLAHGTQHGSYMEEGTGLYGPKRQMYTIRPKHKKALSFMGASGRVVTGAVKHPGIKPRPIIGPIAAKYKVILREAALKLWGV